MTEPRHDMDCPDCGSHYSVSQEAVEFSGLLAEYAQLNPNSGGAVGIDASAIQWLQDIGHFNPSDYVAIVNTLDRKTVGRFVSSASAVTRDRRVRQAWRRVAQALGVTAPFDIVSPEEQS